MGASNNYNVDFPKRTLQLLDSFKNREIDYNLNVTFLMNCLLGLIVTSVENSKRDQLFPGNVDDEFLTYLPDEIELKIGNKPLELMGKNILKTRGKLSTLRNIRNAIAHQHIEPDNDEVSNIWRGVTIWNVNKQNQIDFRVKLSSDQLNSLAVYIATQYLNIQHQNNGKA